MQDRDKSTRNLELAGKREISMFTRSGLLVVPLGWRDGLIQLGQFLYDAGLECFGLVPEAEKDSLRCTRQRVVSAAVDLEIVASELAALGMEPGSSQMEGEERQICYFAGEVAPKVAELAEELEKAATARRPPKRKRKKS